MTLEKLKQNHFNKTIDSGIQINGRGICPSDLNLRCSIGNELANFHSIITWNSNHTFSFSGNCSFPQTISNEGNYILEVWAQSDNKSIKVKSELFKFYRNFPILREFHTDKDRYVHKNDSVILVSGSVSDFDIIDNITVTGTIVEGINYTSQVNIKSNSNYPFELSIPIPNNLSSGEHQLIIKCCDNTNKCVSGNKTFNYEYNSPVLTVSNLSNRTFFHNIDNIIPVSGTVSDFDGDVDFSFTYSIDGNSDNYMPISADSPFSIDISIPDNLSQGKHRISIVCCDNHGCCVSDNTEFNYEYNKPEIKIIEGPSLPVYINRDNFIKFVLNVLDIDGNSNISIYHDLNHTIGNLVNISLHNKTAQKVEYYIPITSEINIGECEIQFHAVDEYDLYSNQEKIIIKFEKYISEDLHIYSFTKRRRH
ncbi:hypothetical protein TVAG_349760 [Trichomonas vaginalis G3]|uniref:Uncharacterized protein n=1 Tax=Trichomonas vaginalis (strain ATCC PRA-98 / G3) TaxID=412133 RepID=A2FYB4_TRIV3|nr:hypothetical protein TVAGG3_0432500 [Trichomonas vaginalis G3]EAX90098.1 hypothetical protein TVAG_349760 [Trichomonas vaginalis G3]KAI5536854.1 hypothetical protein TVAGG3_0432500 [Trichomonas vaginalis G3]|eukprot:XP_001303028.1 hypothetical protein [Trichomonas vaginalis G3]